VIFLWVIFAAVAARGLGKAGGGQRAVEGQ